MNDLTHLDLFSGIGGFALAAGWAGFRTVGFSEVEPYACRLLAERWPRIPNVGDVRIAANFARFRGCTILTGGFPCQPWSAAGKRGGADDDRHLWPAMLRVIEVVRPTWIIGENVPGLDHMGQLDACCDDLAKLGYESQPFEIPACAVDAPHLRERLWIVAHAGREGCATRGICSGIETLGEIFNDGPTDRSSALADTDEKRCKRGSVLRSGQSIAQCVGQALANPARLQQGWEEQRPERERAGEGGESLNVPNAMREPQGSRHDADGAILGAIAASEKARDSLQSGARWLPEPPVGRVANGIPDRAHRLKGLGNAIVPQVVAPFFRWIAQIERGEIT